jgi:hypothetical protein
MAGQPNTPLSTGSTALSNAATAALALGNLILVVPTIANSLNNNIQGYQPQLPPKSDGTPSQAAQPKYFLFDYEGEQSIELTSDITDHFIEDNSSIQDNIALKPVKVTTKGFVSELNDIAPTVLQPLKTVVQKLTALNAYAPAISATAQIAYNEAFFAYQTALSAANSSVQAWSSLSQSKQQLLQGNEFTNPFNFNTSLFATQTRQQIAFQGFYGYWISRTLFSIQTPWAIFKNMAIEKLRPIQSEDSQSFSTFEITFKQIRTVQSALIPPKSAVAQGRLNPQSQALVNNGTNTAQDSISLMQGVTGPTSASFSSLLA